MMKLLPETQNMIVNAVGRTAGISTEIWTGLPITEEQLKEIILLKYDSSDDNYYDNDRETLGSYPYLEDVLNCCGYALTPALKELIVSLFPPLDTITPAADILTKDLAQNSGLSLRDYNYLLRLLGPEELKRRFPNQNTCMWTPIDSLMSELSSRKYTFKIRSPKGTKIYTLKEDNPAQTDIVTEDYQYKNVTNLKVGDIIRSQSRLPDPENGLSDFENDYGDDLEDLKKKHKYPFEILEMTYKKSSSQKDED